MIDWDSWSQVQFQGQCNILNHISLSKNSKISNINAILKFGINWLPAKASRSVDLPQPEGPMTASSCPGLAKPVRPWRIAFLPFFPFETVTHRSSQVKKTPSSSACKPNLLLSVVLMASTSNMASNPKLVCCILQLLFGSVTSWWLKKGAHGELSVFMCEREGKRAQSYRRTLWCM